MVRTVDATGRPCRRQVLQGLGGFAAGVLMLTGCKQPVPPAQATRTGSLQAPTRQPSRPARIGMLQTGHPRGPHFDSLRVELQALGHVEDQSPLFVSAWATREVQLAERAVELLEREPDVIFAPSTAAAVAAKRASGTVPIVMVSAADPVKAGLVTRLSQPEANVTGLTSYSASSGIARLDLLRRAVPGLTRIGVLWDPDEPDKTLDIEQIEDATRSAGLQLHSFEVRGVDDASQALQVALGARLDALITLGDPLVSAWQALIVSLAPLNRLPVLSERHELARSGALMSHGPELADLWRRAATYIGRILRGAPAGSLAVEQVTRARVVVNLKTARDLGLTIPQPVLLQAAEVIQ